MLVGNGSNLLFSDEGYEGVILILEGDFLNIEWEVAPTEKALSEQEEESNCQDSAPLQQITVLLALNLPAAFLALLAAEYT